MSTHQIFKGKIGVMNELETTTAEHPLEPRRSGTISMPGVRVSGGAEHMLAPRSEWQQLRYSAEIGSSPSLARAYRQSMVARKIPLLGEFLGDAIAHHALK